MFTRAEISKLFKDEQGRPLMFTDGQLEIFNCIVERRFPRLHLMCHTRFGKSLTVALAVLMRVATFPEKWAIVAPSDKKARIIMGYIIDHIFDNEYFKSKFVKNKEESEERIRRERSKERINFLHPDGTMGEVFILSADNRNKQNAGESLMGFGAANVVLDESSLIDDDIEAKIFRMLGDSMDNFYCEIGNPFSRNHFYRSYRSPKYHHIQIDYPQGIIEGRLTQEFIDEVKTKPFFSVLYENKFPESDAVDSQGYSRLVTDTEFTGYLQTIEESSMVGERRLGVDVARGGGNFNVWVLRTMNYAKVIAKNQDNDLMSVVGTTMRLAKENGVLMGNVFIDDTGVGAGVTDRLKEQGHPVMPVKLGETALHTEQFINRRAENYWRLKKWLSGGGRLSANDDWSELLEIRYKSESSGKLKMMSKDDMRRMGIESPDVADALMLTFNRESILRKPNDDKEFELMLRKKQMKRTGGNYRFKMT